MSQLNSGIGQQKEPKSERPKTLLDDPVPPMIQRSQQAFQRDLPELLKTRYRQWVAYHGDDRVAFAKTETQLYQLCFARGLKRDEFVVRSIEPLMSDECELSLDV